MTANFKPLDAEEFEQIFSDPDSVEDLLFPEDEEDPFEGQTDIEKSWHAIHFVLTGSLVPDGTLLGEAILGGTPVGSDLGYGPARLIDAERVRAISDALAGVDFDRAFESVDRTSPNVREVYLQLEFSEDEKEYLRSHFMTLQQLYSEVSNAGHALLAYLA